LRLCDEKDERRGFSTRVHRGGCCPFDKNIKGRRGREVEQRTFAHQVGVERFDASLGCWAGGRKRKKGGNEENCFTMLSRYCVYSSTFLFDLAKLIERGKGKKRKKGSLEKGGCPFTRLFSCTLFLLFHYLS